MSKKNKKNLQKMIEKRRALQSIETKTTSKPAHHPELKKDERPTHHEQPETKQHSHHSKEIIRTLASVAIIVVVLIGAFIANKETHYLSDFGNWLYKALRLNS